MTNLNNVSFGNAPVQTMTAKQEVKTSSNPQTAEKTKNNQTKENVITAVGVISLIGAAGILAYNALRGKGNKAAQSVVDQGQKVAQEVTQEVKQQSNKIVRNSAEIIEKRVETATSQMSQGARYQEVKYAAKKNLSHEEKKPVKEALKNLLNERRAAEKKAQIQASELTQTTIKAKSELNTKQLQANKVDADSLEEFKKGVNQTVQEAKDAASQKEQAIKEKIANNEKVTHRETKMAQVAHNNAIDAEVKGNKAIAKAERKAAEKTAQDEARLQHKLEYMENTTLEQRNMHREKMEVNAQKTQANAAKREAKKILEKPRYKRAAEEFKNAQKYSDEKLQGIADGRITSRGKGKDNFDEYEKLIAQNELAQRAAAKA